MTWDRHTVNTAVTLEPKGPHGEPGPFILVRTTYSDGGTTNEWSTVDYAVELARGILRVAGQGQ